MPEMDAIKMLKDDHKKVKGLFREYEEMGDRAMKSKQRTADEICSELDVHATVEEELFYPALEKRAEGELADLIVESYEEHKIIKTLVEEIRGLDPEAEEFDAKVKVLTENVEHHIEEEEGNMFPDAQKALTDVMPELTKRMQARKEELMQQVASMPKSA